MKWPKLSRKQKLARNLVLLAVLLYGVIWTLEFPVLSQRGVLRRLEDAYLLERGSVEVIGEISEPYQTLLCRCGDQLARVSYEWTLLGRRVYGMRMMEPETHFWVNYESECVSEKKEEVTVDAGVLHRVWLTGLLGQAERAELQMTFLDDFEPWEGPVSEMTLHGTRSGDYEITFGETVDWQMVWEQSLRVSPAVLRLYDGEDRLLGEYRYDLLSTGILKTYDEILYETEGGMA